MKKTTNTSEGLRRRRIRGELPRELRDLSDADLDDRHARVWAYLQFTYQLAAGFSPDMHPAAGGYGAWLAALRGALRRAVRDYGIPIARLAEMCESAAVWIAIVARDDAPAMDALDAVWLGADGPDRVARGDLIRVSISGDAARALDHIAGDRDPWVVLSELVLGAARRGVHGLDRPRGIG